LENDIVIERNTIEDSFHNKTEYFNDSSNNIPIIKYWTAEEKISLKEEMKDVVSISDTIENFTSFYDQLNSDEKTIYDAICNGFKEYPYIKKYELLFKKKTIPILD